MGAIAAKILKAISAPCDVPVDDGIVNLIPGASIGISVFPQDGASAAALITRADEAMYEAKANGSGAAFAREDHRMWGIVQTADEGPRDHPG